MSDDIVTRLRHIHMELTVDDYDDVITDAADEIVRLRADLSQLTAESEEWDDDTGRHVARMAGLLHDTANALHGGPLAGGMWSWHDLPNLASVERALADQLAEALRGLQHTTVIGVYRPAEELADTHAALAAYEATRKEEQ